MKTKSPVIFALSGATAGLFLLLLAKVIPLLLLFGVGPAIIGSCLLAVAAENVRISMAKGIAAVLLSIPAYLLAFATFAATASFCQRHWARPSSLLSDLGPDIVLGLVAAVLVASILLESLAFLLSRRWSTLAALGMAGGGIASIGCAYAAKVTYFHLAGAPEGAAQIVILFGPLFILGGAITTMVMGQQIKGTARTN
jgi:hypothetical protein